MSIDKEGYRDLSMHEDNEDTYTPTPQDALKKLYDSATETDQVSVDCWGALEFAIVNDFPDILDGKSSTVQKTRTTFAFTFYGVNIAIQGALVYFITKLLMLPSFKEAQDLYHRFHEEAFEDGAFVQSSFDEFPHHEKTALCKIALSYFFITSVILFLWISTCLRELMTAAVRLMRICNLPALPEGCGETCMVRDVQIPEKESPDFWCICLDKRTKFFLNTLVHIPKMIIAVLLALTGSLWLLASESFGDLILNSLALEFVTQVDELLATAFFPSHFISECIGSFMFKYAKHSLRETAEGDSTWRLRHLCLGYLKFFVAVSVVLIVFKTQVVVPGFAFDVNSACAEFLSTQQPWCSPFQEDCFPID